VSGALSLSIDQARRIAVQAQLLSGPRPASLVEVTRHLGGLQMDPTSAVDRSERIVLWSRLGSYDRREIERELFRHGSLFEYWAYIVPMDDFAIHRETMRRFPRWEGVTGDALSAQCRALGVPSVDVKRSGRSAKGCRRTDAEAAAGSR